MATLKNVTIDDNGFLTLPIGNTAQRPSSPQLGMMRYNNDIDSLEFYDGQYWLRISSLTGIGGTKTLVEEGGEPFAVHSFTSGSSTFALG